jgi:hypothetical protein
MMTLNVPAWGRWAVAGLLLTLMGWLLWRYLRGSNQAEPVDATPPVDAVPPALPGRYVPILEPLTIRNDAKGKGHYGASRSGHRHQGVDYACQPGQAVLAPFAGRITRVAYPYQGDTKLKGLVLLSTDGRTEAKLFYVVPVGIGVDVQAGERLGTAQKVSDKWGNGMLDHVHIEVRVDGTLVDPALFFTTP